MRRERDGIYGDEHSNRKKSRLFSFAMQKNSAQWPARKLFFCVEREFPRVQTRKMTPKCVFFLLSLFFPPETTLHAQQQTDDTTWAEPAVIRREAFHLHVNGWRRVYWNRPKVLSARVGILAVNQGQLFN